MNRNHRRCEGFAQPTPEDQHAAAGEVSPRAATAIATPFALAGTKAETIIEARKLQAPVSLEPLLGLVVKLPDACKCGGNIAVTTNHALHLGSLRCASCDTPRGWLSRETCSFIKRIITEFGPLTAPITIRSGERINGNSGCDPESVPGAQSGFKPKEAIMPRKHEFFPSTYYNAKDVSTGPIMLTIDHVAREPVGDGTNKQDKPVAHFKESSAKLLVLTPTKYDAISLIA
jgi:hypothetical protein